MGSRQPTLEKLATYFERRWRAAGDTPWGDVRACPIEKAKAAILRPHLASAHAVLDLGCGGGDFFSMIAPSTGLERVVGIDVASPAIERARRTGLYDELHVAPIERAHEQVTGRFDFVLLGEILYYVPDAHTALSTAIDRFLGDSGRVAITLAVGRSYFHQSQVARLRQLLSRESLSPVVDDRVDYTYARVPRRYYGWLFAQTHKAVLLYERRST